MVNWSLLNEGLLAYFHASQSVASCAETPVSQGVPQGVWKLAHLQWQPFGYTL